jgi:hypothetical protein
MQLHVIIFVFDSLSFQKDFESPFLFHALGSPCIHRLYFLWCCIHIILCCIILPIIINHFLSIVLSPLCYVCTFVIYTYACFYVKGIPIFVEFQLGLLYCATHTCTSNAVWPDIMQISYGRLRRRLHIAQ